MIKRDGYLLIGRTIASLPPNATKAEIITAFVAALTKDRKEFDADKFRDNCVTDAEDITDDDVRAILGDIL